VLQFATWMPIAARIRTRPAVEPEPTAPAEAAS
jgi:hypothetical protein